MFDMGVPDLERWHIFGNVQSCLLTLSQVKLEEGVSENDWAEVTPIQIQNVAGLQPKDEKLLFKAGWPNVYLVSHGIVGFSGYDEILFTILK